MTDILGLGLPEIPKPEPLRARGGVWFVVGGQQFHVGIEQAFTPARKTHPALLVAPAALDALAQRLDEAGARIQWDHTIPGVRRFYASDPWRNRVELTEGVSG